jgi:hypothetical protein
VVLVGKLADKTMQKRNPVLVPFFIFEMFIICPLFGLDAADVGSGNFMGIVGD